MNETIQNLRNNAGIVCSHDFNQALGSNIREKAESIHIRLVEIHDNLVARNAKPDFLVAGNVMLNMFSKLPEWTALPDLSDWKQEFLYKKSEETQETYEEIEEMTCIGELSFLSGKWLCHHFMYHIRMNEVVIGEFEKWDDPDKWGRLQLANFIL
jgi:hypothetical protein